MSLREIPARSALRPLSVAAAGAAALFLSANASAQMTFSIDKDGASLGMPDCIGLGALSDGDILSPCGGAPAMPVVPGPLPPPVIALPAGALGLLPAGPCVIGPFGPICPNELDALSYGMDAPIFNGLSPQNTFFFSVDEYAVGDPVAPLAPSVFTEGLAFGAANNSADVFTDMGLPGPTPVPPILPSRGNTALVDGDGRRSFASVYAYPGTGLMEPNPPTFLPGPNAGDDLDALNYDPAGLAAPVYFSLDSGFIDPRTGFPNSGTAVAQGAGFVGGDVIAAIPGGPPPGVYAPAGVLGLDLVMGPDTDDLDALALVENGVPGYQPSMTPHDWMFGGSDMLLFSVREGSAIIGLPDSIFGLPISPGDILTTPLVGGASPLPGIFVAAETIGLATIRTGTPMNFDDDLNALDTYNQKQLLSAEYCYGDGGTPTAAGICTPCVCGNNMPPGSQTGCMNSAGLGCRLVASGLACVSADTLRFDFTGASPMTFALLGAGSSRLPLALPCPAGTGVGQPTILNGLRCIGGFVFRYGTRASNAVGDGVAPWGPPSGPPGGVIAFGGFFAGQTRQFQVFYRDHLTAGCGTGLNTSNAVQVTMTP